MRLEDLAHPCSLAIYGLVVVGERTVPVGIIPTGEFQ
jgi:hypothetical protein